MVSPPDPSSAADGGATDGQDVARLREARDTALRAAQAAVRDTTRLTRLLTILSEPAPLKVLLDRVLSALSELFSADIVVLLDPTGTGTYSPLAAIGLPENVIHRPMSGAEHGYSATAMRTGAPVGTARASKDANVDAQLRELGAESVVWLPVADTHSVRGVLILARCRAVPFAHADADLLGAMAYRIGLALEQAQRSAQLEQIVGTGREIGRHLEESAVCTEAVRVLPAVVAADGAALVLSDRHGALQCVAQFGLDSACASTWIGLTERLLVDPAIVSLQPYSTPDVAATPEWPSPAPPPACAVRALLALPIQREERIQGVLYAMRFSATPFSWDTIQVGTLYAGQASAALENARLYRVVRDELAERVRAEHQLRESEERLMLALMGADLGMWDWNLVTSEIHFNDRAAEMLGHSADEIGRDPAAWEKLVHPDDLPRVLEALQAHLDGATPYYESEHRFLAQSGESIWILSKGKVTHRDAEGRPLRLVGTYLDITEAKQIQAERLLMEQQKQQVWRAESLSRMAGGIAHHFNNLLTVVLGNLELALQDLPREAERRSCIDEAMKASWRAAEIGHLMLAYLGQTTGRKEPLDLAEITRDALPLQTASLPKQVRLKTQLPPAGPIILADGVRVKQIVTNLLSNAIEAMGARGGEIAVAVGLVDVRELRGSALLPSDWDPQPGEYACLSVSDTGCGLDAATADRIFEPFFSTKSIGRGLGLPVALGLARAHGGSIAVESQPGRGAVFRVLFPLQTAQLPPPRLEQPPASAAADGGGLVLLVEDEPMVRSVARAQLERLGYQVVTACDGIEAVDAFRERRNEIRLVLLDLAMPRMDGWDTLAALRRLEPGVRIVLVSGYDESQVMHGVQQERPQSFLQKPYNLKDLKAALAADDGWHDHISGDRSTE